MALPSSYYPGDISKMYPAGQERGERLSQNVEKGVDKIKEGITSGFNIMNWIRGNWQIVILAAIAIVLLLRRI